MQAYSTEIRVGEDLWSMTYVDFDPKIPIGTRHEISAKALHTLKKRTKNTRIKGDGYEGTVSRKAEAIIGSFAGTLLEVLVETDAGTSHQAILARKYIDSSLN